MAESPQDQVPQVQGSDAAGTPAPSAASAAAPPLGEEELNNAILRQVEYYFSRENLSKDHYLLSMMDESKYVPLDIIAQFSRVKQLTSDVALIARVMEGSSLVALDDTKTKIRPSAKAAQRNTVILRDLPSTVTLEDINELWANSPYKVGSVKPDLGCWFVTFESESVAMDAVMWVRNQKLAGEKIRARLKTESVAPSVFFQPPPVYQPAPVGYAVGAWTPDMRAYQWGGEGEMAARMGDKGGDKRRQFPRRPKGGVPGVQGGSGLGGAGGQEFRKGNEGRRKRNARKGQGAGAVASNGPAKKPQQEFKLGATHFPPLPRKSGGGPGYSGEYQSYSKKDFIAAIRGADPSRPEMASAEVVLDAPNGTLETDVDHDAPTVGDAPASTTDGGAEVCDAAPAAAAPPAPTSAAVAVADSSEVHTDTPTLIQQESGSESASTIGEGQELRAKKEEIKEEPKEAGGSGPKQTWAQKIAASRGDSK